MPRIVWDESYSVGNQDIDTQHQKWIAIINELHDTLMADKINTETKLKILNEMIDYGKLHFAYEEQFMQNIGYEMLDAHKEIHRNFLKYMNQCKADELSGHVLLNTEIMKTLMNWLQDHILREDKKYQEAG